MNKNDNKIVLIIKTKYSAQHPTCPQLTSQQIQNYNNQFSTWSPWSRVWATIRLRASIAAVLSCRLEALGSSKSLGIGGSMGAACKWAFIGIVETSNTEESGWSSVEFLMQLISRGYKCCTRCHNKVWRFPPVDTLTIAPLTCLFLPGNISSTPESTDPELVIFMDNNNIRSAYFQELFYRVDDCSKVPINILYSTFSRINLIEKLHTLS